MEQRGGQEKGEGTDPANEEQAACVEWQGVILRFVDWITGRAFDLPSCCLGSGQVISIE